MGKARAAAAPISAQAFQVLPTSLAADSADPNDVPQPSDVLTTVTARSPPAPRVRPASVSGDDCGIATDLSLTESRCSQLEESKSFSPAPLSPPQKNPANKHHAHNLRHTHPCTQRKARTHTDEASLEITRCVDLPAFASALLGLWRGRVLAARDSLSTSLVSLLNTRRCR